MSSDSSPPFSWQFNLGRIPVVVEPSFWLISLLFCWDRYPRWDAMLSWVGAVFVSVLVHELGHALVAMALGCDVVAIRLYSFGGLTMFNRRLSRWRDVLVSASGPFAGFFFGALIFAASLWFPPHTRLARYVLGDLLFVNFAWGIINLLPVPPLDGGHISRGVLGPSRQRLALWVGLITALGVVAWALSVRDYYLAVLFGLLGLGCWQQLSVTRDLKPLQPQPVVEPEPDALARGWRALRAGQEAEAARLAHHALSAARPGEESNAARDLLAWVALTEGNARLALSHLEKVQPPEAARPYSLAMAYEAVGLPERALPPALAALEHQPTEAGGALAVRLLVRARRLDEAERVARDFSWTTPARRDSALADVALAREDFPAAASLFAQAFEASGRAEDAYQAARSHARGGQVEAATLWLQRALEAGYDDLEALSQEPALAPVRARPEIAERLARRGSA